MNGYLAAALLVGYCFALSIALVTCINGGVHGVILGVIAFAMVALPPGYFFDNFIFN